ncbi:MAG: hypothetical protein ACQES8_07305 [Thermodesulfobacteriota bacterium]
MNKDFDRDIGFEVKKDIADRYFDFRRLIEEDTRNYEDRVRASSALLEQKVGFDMIRLYILLKDQQLIREFLELTGLKQMIFYDPGLNESETIKKKAFKDRNVKGLTRKNRFINMVFDTYQDLGRHIEEYREILKELAEEREYIADEIKAFYDRNDLSAIMGFMRGLEDSSLCKTSSMEGGLNPKSYDHLEQKMKLTPPQPVEELLPIIPRLPPLSEIKSRLKKIIDRAWQLQPDLNLKELVRTQSLSGP